MILSVARHAENSFEHDVKSRTRSTAASLLARETDRAEDTKLLRYINYIHASFADHNEIRDEPAPR